MKIAILSRYQQTHLRGVESFVSELSKRFPQDWQVDIIIGQESDSFSKIIDGKYDIVMPLNGRMQSLKASIGRLFSNYKLVIGGHSGIGKDDIWNIAVAKPDVFIALTNHMANWSRKWAWWSKVIKISNGVNLENFSPQGKRKKTDLPGKVVLSVGALEWYKHHELAIEAVSKLDAVSLLIIGSGSDQEKLYKLGNERLKGRFKIEQVPYSEMPQAYRGCDLFTLPSWDREAFGIVYLEAMASGLAVVAPDDLSRREIVGEAGVLVDVAKPEKYAAAIEEALAKNWGSRPRKQAEKFSWEKVAKEYIRCFENLKP